MDAETNPAANSAAPAAPATDQHGATGPHPALDLAAIEAQAIEMIRTVFDPEIPVDIWELGLIYGIEVAPTGYVTVKMTLTSPMCPSAQELPLEVEQKVRAIPGVTSAAVDIVWDPMWNQNMMSESAKLKLGFF